MSPLNEVALRHKMYLILETIYKERANETSKR